MKLTRQEDRSLYLFLKDSIISPEYAEYTGNSTLVSAGNGKWDMQYEGDIHPFKRGDYSGLGRGLLYFDVAGDLCRFGVEQEEMVEVNNGTLLQRGSDYTVNYLTGQVYSGLDLSSATVDFFWNYVAVIDAWPDDEVPNLPVVSIALQRGHESPQQLGEAGGIREASWHIEIFGSNKGERDDLMDIVFDGLKLLCPIYMFEYGLPLTREGTYNQDFLATQHANFRHLNFENVEKSLTGLPRWAFWENERINKYRAAITFDTKAYKR